MIPEKKLLCQHWEHSFSEQQKLEITQISLGRQINNQLCYSLTPWNTTQQ